MVAKQVPSQAPLEPSVGAYTWTGAWLTAWRYVGHVATPFVRFHRNRINTMHRGYLLTRAHTKSSGARTAKDTIMRRGRRACTYSNSSYRRYLRDSDGLQRGQPQTRYALPAILIGGCVILFEPWRCTLISVDHGSDQPRSYDGSYCFVTRLHRFLSEYARLARIRRISRGFEMQ